MMGPHSTQGHSALLKKETLQQKRNNIAIPLLNDDTFWVLPHFNIFPSPLFCHPHYILRSRLGRDDNPTCQRRKRNAGQVGNVSMFPPNNDWPNSAAGVIFPWSNPVLLPSAFKPDVMWTFLGLRGLWRGLAGRETYTLSIRFGARHCTSCFT